MIKHVHFSKDEKQFWYVPGTNEKKSVTCMALSRYAGTQENPFL
jgi:hypothetical protein